MRFIGLDVHRDFCEVAIAEVGRVRLAGRVQTGPQALALFAQSLAADDQAALEATGDALEIARILEPHVGRVVLANPKAVKGDHPCGRKDRQDRRARWRGCSPAACCRRSGCRTSRPALRVSDFLCKRVRAVGLRSGF
jgi:hypothetical protein